MTEHGVCIGLITPQYAPAIGGVERHVEILARGLTQRGVRVEVITTDPTGNLARIEERDGVLVRRFPTLTAKVPDCISPALGWWLWRNAARFALLHAHSYHAPLTLQSAVVSRWRGVPLVITSHYHGAGHSVSRQALHIPYRVLGNGLMHQAGRVICVSAAERALVVNHFGTDVKSVVVPNAIEIEEIGAVRPHEKPDGRTLVLAVGRLETYKQHDHLIAAVSSLPPNFDLVIVGDGPARSHIERQIAALSQEGRVRRFSNLPRGELLRWYRTADVFVTMSRRESFGLTILEAAAAGARVVASDIPSHREVASYLSVERVSFVNPDCTPEELARTVEQAACDGRIAVVDPLRFPTREEMIDGALACYHMLLDDRVSRCESEGIAI